MTVILVAKGKQKAPVDILEFDDWDELDKEIGKAYKKQSLRIAAQIIILL
ncbi:MAG: hypothetical protein R2764_03740 [Bacteroidales bacterium]